jgi:RND family efflux transporter MFP subunit
MAIRTRTGILGCLLAVSALLFGCGAEEVPSAPPPSESLTAEAEDGEARIRLVEADRVVLDRLAARVEASGSIRARRVSKLGAEVRGRIVKVYVDVGDRVEVGDPLFQVDPLPYALTLAEIKASLTLARAERDNALGERARVERLMEKSAVSESMRDSQQAAAVGSVARVAQLVVKLERAKYDIDRTVVRAPYAGSIVERFAHEGEMAGARPMLTLQESGELEVALNIPESSHATVRVGSTAKVFVEGLVDPIETAVHRVSDRIDTATRTYEVRAPLVDPSGVAKAGSYVRAEVTPMSLELRPVVDRTAVFMRDGRNYVFRVVGGIAREIPVRVWTITPDRAEIVSGVEEGQIVVKGEAVRSLQDGDAVVARVLSSPVAAAGGGVAQ